MTESLSVAAGIAGLFSLGVKVTESLLKFYESYKGQSIEISRITERLKELLEIFRSLHTVLQGRHFQPSEQNLLESIESCANNCDDVIQELKEECEKFKEINPTGAKGAIKAAGRRVTYPFRQSTLQKLGEAIDHILQNLSLSLGVLQLRDLNRTQDNTSEIESVLDIIRVSQISAELRAWLGAPDAAVNHEAACAKRSAGTGAWFIQSPIFTTWLSQDNSFLWLNGFAGCGKSVLCSTVIQRVFHQKPDDQRVGLAFFYFTFNDVSKQDDLAMLKALVLQLSGQLPDFQKDLARLRDLNHSASLQPAALVAHLQELFYKFDQVYIMLDALDESPRYSKRDGVLGVVQIIRQWLVPGLHLLATSRDETDIRESLEPAKDDEVIMKNAEIDQDIRNFISVKLRTEQWLRKWQEHHDQIQQVLADRAQ